MADYEKLRSLWAAYCAADDRMHSSRRFGDFTNHGRDEALSELNEEYERVVPLREQRLVEAGQGTTCCCCTESASVAWCEVTFEEGDDV